MRHRSKLISAGRRLSTVTTINMTPLIDLAFALLIIFIIATPLLEQTIPINLPIEQADAANQRKDIDYQTISIDPSGQIFWGKTPVNLNDLNTFLGRFAEQPDPPVINLRADAQLQYQAVIEVIDLIKENQLEKLSLDTQAQ